MVGIYKIVSPTGKVYIGQSWNIEGRVSTYRTAACKGQTKLYNSITKYGWSKHSFKVIHSLPEDITQEVLDAYEIFYWQQYKDSNSILLNLKTPGSRGKHSDESKKKMGESRKGNKNHLGHIHSEETKRKISEAGMGRVAWNKGCSLGPMSEEQKQKRSKTLTGRTFSEETLKRMSEARKGKPGRSQSEETKRKISETRRKRNSEKVARSK
jgi:group I intron endonuclease